jgi:ABC-type lipoprotein export system ATPase subunit
MVTHDPRIAAYADRILRASVQDGAIVDETHLDAQNIGNAGLVADKIKTIR